ncbi:hypothetical protein ACA910_008088 [Epithemia clementina (nom. ined.)]
MIARGGALAQFSSTASSSPTSSQLLPPPPPPPSNPAELTSTTPSGTPRSPIYANAATKQRVKDLKESKTKIPKNLLVKVGAPFVLFSILAAWVVSNALDGKLRELEASQGKVSKSLRQAALEAEHEEMMERLNKIVQSDFDNTKRIKRPHEVLEERRLEREKRNAWHRRLYRAIFGEKRKD